MTTDLQKMAEGIVTSMERPDFIKGGTSGTEHIEQKDVQLPRLAIAQSLSPQITEGDPKLIEGLKNGDMFNVLTNEIYGRGPLTFAVIRGDRPRFVEFIPRNEGGGVRDPNVPADDPRTLFRKDEVTGKTLNPIATKFYDYVVVLFHQDGRREVVVISFKSTGLKVAQALNALIKLRQAPIYAGIYSMTSRQQKNSKGVFFQFDIKNAGWPKDQATATYLEELHLAIKNKEIKHELDVDATPDPEEDDSFDYGANAPAPGSPESQM